MSMYSEVQGEINLARACAAAAMEAPDTAEGETEVLNELFDGLAHVLTALTLPLISIAESLEKLANPAHLVSIVDDSPTPEQDLATRLVDGARWRRKFDNQIATIVGTGYASDVKYYDLILDSDPRRTQLRHTAQALLANWVPA